MGLNKIDEAYAAIDKEDYSTAEAILSKYLKSEDRFDVRLGLGVCYFHKFSETKDQSHLDTAIQHLEEARNNYDHHFDVHLILGQCYSAKYFNTWDPAMKQSAKNAYEQSRKFISTKKDFKKEDLEKRLRELSEDLDKENPVSLQN